jgi:hypothetical protein
MTNSSPIPSLLDLTVEDRRKVIVDNAADARQPLRIPMQLHPSGRSS